MAQFDVFRNPNPETSEEIPYLLDVQTGLLDQLVTRVVAPLVMASAMKRPVKVLNPSFTIEGVPVVMSTAELAGVPIRALGERAGSLEDKRTEIIAALDLLFTGI